MFVGKVAFVTTEEDLAQLFYSSRETERVQIITDLDNGRSQGTGSEAHAERESARSGPLPRWLLTPVAQRKAQHVCSRFTANYVGWTQDSTKFDIAVERLIYMLRATPGAREEPS